MAIKSEKEMILEVLSGELSSYEPIVKKYQNMIYVHAYKILKDPDEAEDVTQETFVRAFENLRNFDLEKPLKAWLYKIATNYCYDIIRKNSRVSKLSWDVKDSHASLVDKIIETEERSEVRQAVDRLPNKYKKPLKKYYFENLSYKSVATKLHLPINTIRTRLRRGKKLLKEDLK